MEITTVGVVAAAGCTAVGVWTGVVTGAICGAGIIISYKLKCADCATTCPGGPKRSDCRTRYVDEEFNIYRERPPDNRPPPRRYRR